LSIVTTMGIGKGTSVPTKVL